MSERPKRLQGTDGVRGPVASDEQARQAGLNPVSAFIEQRLITPSFVELYCFAFALELQEAGLAAQGQRICVGYDPRDTGRELIDAALSGLSKAAALPEDVGVLPTPAVGLYALSSAAAGAVVITASHNPADQNGIKLFLPKLGLKLFPADDERLTRRIYDLEKTDLAGLSSKFACADGAGQARESFSDFFADPYNSWIKERDFADTILVVDAANGALAGLAAPILERFGFALVQEVGAATDGSVNANCGAGLLEGHGRIGPDFFSDAGGDFRPVELIQAMFRHGRANREEIRAGRLRVSGAAFDADGDRFYRLEYSPRSDEILVLSGDEIAYHQAAFLRSELGEKFNRAAAFVTTVESDLAAASAAEGIGYVGIRTGVGDKWLLWEAYCALLSACFDSLSDSTADVEVLKRIEDLENRFWESGEPSGFEMISFFRRAEEIAAELDADLGALSQDPERATFAIGSEETGHAVSAGRVVLPDNRQRVVYFGNGLKSAINLMAATADLASEIDPQDYYDKLHRPFPQGFKKTIPVYYTNRSLLRPGTDTWLRLEAGLAAEIRKHFGNLKAEFRARAEEPDMLYFALSDPVQTNEENPPSTRAAVFIRNSGTEEKTSVYLRGERSLAEGLEQIGRELSVELAGLMKNPASAYWQAELAVLGRLAERGPLAIADLSDLLGGVNPERLMLEISLKEGLLAVDGSKLALTERARRLLDLVNKETTG